MKIASWYCSECVLKSTGEPLKHHKDEPCPLCGGKLEKVKEEVKR